MRRAQTLLPITAVVVVLTAGCGPTGQSPAAHSTPTSAGVAAVSSVPTSAHTHASRSSHTKQSRRSPNSAVSQDASKTTAIPRPRVHLAGVPAMDMPDHGLTPGDVLTTKASVVCVSGYSSSVRDVPESEKEEVYVRYGIPHVPYAHEVDHLVSLELGGSNAITNLWPEPYQGRWGAHTKDVLENRLHAFVCAGRLTLVRAQRLEAANWVKAYRRFVGTPPPASTPAAPAATPASPGAATASSGSCEPGYSPCLPRVSDLNCGDIPDSKKPIRVTGSDPYGLDADHNGWGCTS